MKRVKNYIESELAKRKVARYKYWSIKDETGITIVSSDDAEDRSFAEILDKIIADNVDAEVQVKFGTTESSSRQNTPLFIRINEAIEWVEPEEDETIKINGVPHKVDKNGNVNINLTTPEPSVIEASPMDSFSEKLEMQLEGLRKENELQKQQFSNEMQNKLFEQTLKFKEMMLTERESRIVEKEQLLAQQEAIFEEKQKEMSDDVKGYVKHIPKALGGLVRDWLKEAPKKQALGQTEKPKRKRNKVEFDFEPQVVVNDELVNEEDFEEMEQDETQQELNNIDTDFEEVEPENQTEENKTQDDEQL